MKNWPFPPVTGPVPWTAAKQAAYKREQHKQLPDAPF